MNIGYTVIPVLEFLNGEPYDDRALDFIHALRPSAIRSAGPNEMLTCDGCPWRVTVLLDERGAIKKMEQEVEVGLRTADNGHCLSNKIQKGTWPKGGMAIVNMRALEKVKL